MTWLDGKTKDQLYAAYGEYVDSLLAEELRPYELIPLIRPFDEWLAAERSIAETMEPDLADRRLLRKILVWLWTDLARADAHSQAGRTLSLGTLDVLERLIEVELVAGPTRWRDVEIPMLTSGIFETVHRSLGFVVPADEIHGWLEEQRRTPSYVASESDYYERKPSIRLDAYRTAIRDGLEERKNGDD